MEKPPEPQAPLPSSPAYAVSASLPYNPWAIASLAFAASTVIGTWCVGGLIAVITGHVARQQIKRTGEAGGNLALAGLIVGYVAIGLTLAFIAVYIVFVLLFFAIAPNLCCHSPSPTASP